MRKLFYSSGVNFFVLYAHISLFAIGQPFEVMQIVKQKQFATWSLFPMFGFLVSAVLFVPSYISPFPLF